MKHYTLRNSGVQISEEVFGCWAIGGTYFTGAEDAMSIAAIRSAIDHGINTLDTAPAYGHGHSENLVAEAIRGMDRSDVVISTKLPRSLLARENVRPSCEKSLRDLSTDYIDIYFIHWPSDKGDPIAETMEELMKLKDCGKIRCIGLSNFSTAQIIEAEKYGEVDVLQPCWSLLWRYQDDDSLRYAKEHGIGVINYSPLAQGILTGKFAKNRVFDVNDGRSHASLFQQPYFNRALDLVDALRPYAEKYGVTMAQLSIRMCMQNPAITAPIVGAKSDTQVLDNVKACDFEISAEDYKAIDALSKEFTDTLPAFKNFFWQ
ncbi:MAG: aldo/keto reductase [Lachnospiraceae bacterium]|nr:aldo/keto reductase [Lachnospiraceae bacterium]